MDRPNIILLMADQMRGDCLGIAGHPDVKTPYLDALAAEGSGYAEILAHYYTGTALALAEDFL